MKQSSEYLIKELGMFSDKFEFVSVRYAYDYSSEFHVIEIERNESCQRDLEFAKWKTGLWHGFYENYPSEDLLVTRSGKINEFSVLLYENAGHSYESEESENYSLEYLFPKNDCPNFEQEYLAA